MATQYSAQIYDLSTMSRPDSGNARPLARAVQEQASPTMSYPTRIAAMLADAPQPPALRRGRREAAAPLAVPSLTEETRARLISVHTLNATLG